MKPFTLDQLPPRLQEQVGVSLHGVKWKRASMGVTSLKDATNPVESAEREFRFHPVRKWRFDYAWPAQKVALEVDGSIWTGGRHTRGSGWMKDTEKLNTAACLGWRLLRCTPQQLKNGQILPVIQQALGA